MKKTLLIIGILVVVAVAAYLILQPKSGSTPDGGQGFSIANFLPFGSNDELPTTQPTNTNQTQNNDLENISGGEIIKLPNRLRKVSSEPVAGAVAFNVGSTTYIRFVEKGTGNVYEARSDSDKVERLTNTTIPKIIRAFWLPNGNGFLAQTIIPETEMVETNFVKLSKSTSTSTEVLTPYNTTISKLPTDIKELSIKPDGTKVFYYQITQTGSDWFISNIDGTSSTKVYSSKLIEWVPNWISPNSVIMQTKSSAASLGYAYTFDLNTKNLKKVVGGAVGLSIISTPKHPSYLISVGGGLPTLNYVAKDGISTNLSKNTLAEKCVWGNKDVNFVFCAIPQNIPSSIYPDSWYKGLTNTEDSIIKINITDNIYYLTSDLSQESKQKIDVVDPQISPDDSHLIFRNKLDGYLWVLRITE